ncbi:glucagon receptor-like [Poecilia latipinna]|uniref:glucagon receptor-like n=1 Tax=Poecilia latipinna TaxID=48699 RepID=UPI00072DF562|nr:PREDICTED: glucagon receptor-like [Poecilia latipinna]
MGKTRIIKALVLLLLFILLQLETGSGKVLEETYLKWLQYKQDCIKMMQTEPPPQEGLFCNRTFDRYACWPDAAAGFMVNVSCPFYLPWFHKVSQGSVRRRCGSDGLWETDEGGHVWRDISECEEEEEAASQELWAKQLMVGFRTLYTVGYSLSLSTLIMALIIVLSFRKLHCTRNYIHANLFLSFILRAVAVIVKDSMLDRHLGREIVRHADVTEMLSHQAAIGCRVAQVMMQYCVLANHYWFFGEAIYLYSVLISCVFIDNNKYLPYLCLGWGTPLLFVVPWAVMKVLKENKECWAVNENMNYWWIIRFPVLSASLINFLIFMKILGVIFSKLRANIHSRYPDYKLRLAKATLTLIPLFGVHEVIFIFATDEQTTGLLRYIKVFFTLFISSFQGLLVAVLYCYANKEVQTELRRKLRSWRTETEILRHAQ